jgi:hypothetical protein
VGFEGLFYLGPKLTSRSLTQHGSIAWFGQGYGDFIDNPDGQCLNANDELQPATIQVGVGAGSPAVQLGTALPVETYFVWSPQLTIFQRPNGSVCQHHGTPSNLGDIDNYVVGYRYNPFMTSRAGFAFHNEFSWFRQRGVAPDGVSDLSTNSLMAGFDFAF